MMMLPNLCSGSFSATDPDPLTERAPDSILIRIRCMFAQIYHHTWSKKVLLTCFLEEELPMAPVGPLRQCLCPLALQTSILYLHSSLHLGCSSLGLSMNSVSYSLLNIPTFLVFFTSLGIWFQLSTTLFEKKFLLTSSLAGLDLRWSGPSVLWIWILSQHKGESLLHSKGRCINMTRTVIHGSFNIAN